MSFDLEIKTAAQSIHSSYANIVPNAANRLAHALSLLTNAENQIIIPNFNQDILPLDEMTIEAFKRLSINYAKMKTNFGIDQKWHMSDIVDKLYNQPTLNISQIQAGSAYSNNSIPNTATAKIDCRFLPGQKPEKLLEIIRTYLDEKGYSDVNIINSKSEESYRSNLNSEYVTSLLKCAGTIYGSENVKLIPNFAGGGPMSLFGNLFNIPIVSLGVSYSGSNVHSPNENIRLKDLEQNIQCLLNWFSMIK